MAQTVSMTAQSSVAANGSVDNAFQGKRFERAPFSGFISLYTTGSAAGLLQELNVGGRSITPRDPVNSQNRIPVVPDDMIVSGIEVYQGELIQLSLANTTAGALTHYSRIILEEGEVY